MPKIYCNGKVYSYPYTRSGMAKAKRDYYRFHRKHKNCYFSNKRYY